jgi:hypothetical protein
MWNTDFLLHGLLHIERHNFTIKLILIFILFKCLQNENENENDCIYY